MTPAAREPVLRRAVPADLDAIMAIETSTFAHDAWSAATMGAELAGDAYYLVAVDDDAVVAYAGLQAHPGSDQGDIQTIAVAEGARGVGLGRRLMVALLDEARRRGVGQIFLEVREDNPTARRLYESLGFVKIGVRPHYYMPDDVTAETMRVTL